LSGFRKPIEPSTSVNFDIRLDGDDAFELLDTIRKRFGTRFDTLDWHKYFNDEVNENWVWLNKLLGRAETRQNLTFEKLLEVVQKGSWFEG